MRTAVIVLDIATQALDQGFTYRVPDFFPSDLIGRAVLVPFGNRKAVGFVVRVLDDAQTTTGFTCAECVDNYPENLSLARLKDIEKILTEPYFTEIGARCALYLSQHYLAPLSACVRLLTPPGSIPKIEKIDGVWQPTMPLVTAVDDRWVVRLQAADDYVVPKRAVKQQLILSALRQGDLRVSDLKAEYGAVDQSLKGLEKKGLIRIERRRRMRGAEPTSEVFAARAHVHECLTPDQQQALHVIRTAQQAAAEQENAQVVVLDGVTGSGKTEVYLCALEEVLRAGKTAIVLVPEISLTPQTVARFRGRFGNSVAVLHSRMSQGERYDQWDSIRQGYARVVVGARSALFAPLNNVGIIVVDEEHESSYKQDQAPRYVTREVAEYLAHAHHAVVVLGSATPSIEALYQVRHKPNWHKVCMPHRANGKPLPQVHVVDMAREFNSGSRQMFSKTLQTALLKTRDEGNKAVLLLNQRGFAQFLLCRDCGFVPTCASCSTSLTYHATSNTLVCHHCGYKTSVMPTCPKCGSPYLKRFGAGTQRVEAELRTIIDVPIIRMDADTTAHKGDHQRLLEEFARTDTAILLGTQMIAKGLDFDEVTLVGVINADTMLNLPDYRAAERTFNLLEQVAGRCGRGSLPGEVIIQTYQAQSSTIRSVAHHDKDAFLAEELALRKSLRYPPYVLLVNILLWGKNESEVERVAHDVYRGVTQQLDRASVQGLAGEGSNYEQEDNPLWEVFPPTPCVLARLKGSYRFHIIIKLAPQLDAAGLLSPYFRQRKPTKGVSVSVDINPDSLL